MSSGITRELVLFHTAGCHLCELAAALTVPVALRERWHVREIDISTADVLIDRYGVRIPVVRRTDTGAELGWPFDEDSLQLFLG